MANLSSRDIHRFLAQTRTPSAATFDVARLELLGATSYAQRAHLLAKYKRLVTPRQYVQLERIVPVAFLQPRGYQLAPWDRL